MERLPLPSLPSLLREGIWQEYMKSFLAQLSYHPALPEWNNIFFFLSEISSNFLKFHSFFHPPPPPPLLLYGE